MSKKIKIIHVIGRLDVGGAERLLLDMCRKIDKSKFDVSVLSLKGAGALLADYEKAGIPVVVMEKKRKFQLSLFKKMEIFFRLQKPDIVQTHLFIGDFYGGVAGLMANVPVLISTKHDILSEGFWRDFLGRKLRKKFNRVVAISQATRNFLLKKEKMSVDKVTVIYNGIDVDKFYEPQSELFSSPTITLGAVGRLSVEKGHEYLLRACSFIKEKNWRLLVVGDGPQKKKLQKMTQKYVLQDQIKFVGEVFEVRDFLRQIDIFVLPSVSEGLSLAVIEAALAGKFIIASNVGGVPEIIKDKQTGLLVKPKDIEQLVEAIDWACENKEQVSKMAKELQRQVKEVFDINKIIKIYEKLYSTIVR